MAQLDEPQTATPAPASAAILDRTNRTFICSVLFLDIIEYSRKPVSEQILLKERFNALIADSIRDIAPNDRIILDTGDGAAVNFLGDPEDALFVAMTLRDAFKRPLASGLVLEVRIGLNLGPVRLVKDLNSQPNIIGDGINVAQRVMSFADRGQVLVSRSYFEVVSHISEGYAQLFSYRGSRTDKHVREHEIYEVGTRLPDHIASKAAAASRNPENPEAESSGGEPAAALLRPDASLKHPWWSNARAAYVAALASVLVLAAAVVVSERRPETVVVAPAKTIVAAPVTTTTPAPEKQVVRKMVELDDLLVLPPDPAPEPRDLTLSRKRATRVASTEVAAVASRPEPPAAPPRDPSPPVPATGSAQGDAASAEKAVIAFAVSPWGEVFVNGAKLGVSPPVNVVEVSAGKAEVEIRNPGFPSYTQTVELAPGQRIRVKHKF
jgi:hypothetical protein